MKPAILVSVMVGAMAVERKCIERGSAVIEVLVEGQGACFVLLPSLGRGQEDFDAT